MLNANPYPATKELFAEFYNNAVSNLIKYVVSGDIVCYTYNAGTYPNIMRKLKSIYNDIFHVETGIGYFNTYADFRAFESYHCHSYVMGHNNKSGKRPYGGTSPGAPSFSDWVIPNYFEEGDFDFSPNDKEDYFVYLGRMHRWTKGTEIAMQVSEKCNLPLLMAGPDEPDGHFKKTKLPKGIEYVGSVGLDERRKLLSKAKGKFMPSLFAEPFGGSGVESLLSGTPVISTDWASFSEWNLHGYTGYRCRTFSEFCWAANNIDSIDNEFCYNWAKGRYTLPVVGKKFDRMFTYIQNIYNGDGFYENEELDNLDYLEFSDNLNVCKGFLNE